MDKNLNSYVLTLDNWLDQEKCQETITQLEKINWQQHTYENQETGKIGSLNGEQELNVSMDIIPNTNYVMERNWYALRSYMEHFKFPWFHNWQGFTNVRFNRYHQNSIMSEHCDHIHTMFDGNIRGIPTLTILSLLNDDFTGGELVMWNDTVIPLKTGTTVIFPSVFLYPHKVNSILSGVRYSCVSWAY